MEVALFKLTLTSEPEHQLRIRRKSEQTLLRIGFRMTIAVPPDVSIG